LRSNSKEEQGDRSQESHREGRIREAREKQATLLKSEGHSGSVGVHEEKVEEKKYLFSEASWLQKISRSFRNTDFDQSLQIRKLQLDMWASNPASDISCFGHFPFNL